MRRRGLAAPHAAHYSIVRAFRRSVFLCLALLARLLVMLGETAFPFGCIGQEFLGFAKLAFPVQPRVLGIAGFAIPERISCEGLF